MHVLEVIPSRCNGCGICEVACSQYCAGEANPEKSHIRVFRREDKATTFPFVVDKCDIPEKECPWKGNGKSCPKIATTLLSCPVIEEGALVMLCRVDCKEAACVKFCPMQAIEIVEEIPGPEKEVGVETIAESLLTIGRK